MGAIIRFVKNYLGMPVRLANLCQNTILFIVHCKTNQGNAILVCTVLYNNNYMFYFWKRNVFKIKLIIIIMICI